MAKICHQTGIETLLRRLGGDTQWAFNNVRNATGNRNDSLVFLRGYYMAKSLHAWFVERDLDALRRHAYLSAKLDRMSFQLHPGLWQGAFCHFMPLVSGDERMIDWYGQFISPLYRVTGGKAVRNRVGCPEYHAFQAILALQGKWQLLGERAEYILANPPGKKMARYQIDQEFYLALAKGDMVGMEQALHTLTVPLAKFRNFDGALVLTQHLMSMFGYIYAKIAWRAGYQVQVDSPYLPMEWLALEGLQHYEELDITQGFDLFQPFAEEYAALSPVADPIQRFDVTLGSRPTDMQLKKK